MPCDSCEAQSEVDAVAVKGLCAVLTALEKRGDIDVVLDAVDWAEAGIDWQDFDDWWAHHKKEDAERRRREAAAIARERLAQEAYDKLTPAQREALGVRAPGKF